MSAELTWQVIRNSHAHLLKKRNVKKPFSTEPNNLKNVNSPRYNGLCRRKVIGIEPASGGKGIILSHKTAKYQNKPVKNVVKTTIKAGPRRALNSIRRFIRHNSYRKDLKMAALRRASAILRSQRAQPFKKARRRTHKAVKKE
ncbi:60S ribosomal protein L28-like [Eriocheir sinensis]|uniref:60S ribosomal protein L28-like n=1 Tax=Eriocheir sinensis TaxID=95602 RepID=UPI001AA0BAAD|nr:60S ribosomal protein L28-like [Eriocheir sinensis]MBO1764987.1 60S ribosomal protein L28 [Escherichia coli]